MKSKSSKFRLAFTSALTEQLPKSPPTPRNSGLSSPFSSGSSIQPLIKKVHSVWTFWKPSCITSRTRLPKTNFTISPTNLWTSTNWKPPSFTARKNIQSSLFYMCRMLKPKIFFHFTSTFHPTSPSFQTLVSKIS